MGAGQVQDRFAVKRTALSHTKICSAFSSSERVQYKFTKQAGDFLKVAVRERELNFVMTIQEK